MKLRQYTVILRSRRKLAMLTFSSVIAATIALNMMLPTTWKSESVLVLNQQAKDPMSEAPVMAYMVPGYIDTQAEIAASHNVALKVVDALGLDKFDETKKAFIKETNGAGSIRDWLADALLRKLVVKPGRESGLITIQYTAEDPKFAALVANAFTQAYMNTVIDMQDSGSLQQSQVFQAQLQTLRGNLEKARQRLAEYQKQVGIVVDPLEHIDLQTQHLNDLSTQLAGAQVLELDAKARTGGGDLAPDVANSPLIQQMKTAVAQSDAKFQMISEKFGSNHPLYQQALAELEANRQQLAALTQQSVTTVRNNANDAAMRKAEVMNALSSERDSVLQRQVQSAEVDALQKEVEEAQRAYSLALAHFSDTDMASHVSHTDVYVLETATEPLKPSWPKPFLSLFVAVVFGAFFSVGAAFLAEFINRRVHSIEDVESLLGLPVLADVRPSPRLRHRMGSRWLRSTQSTAGANGL